jgi:lysophospholipase L1-like esterase
MPLQPASKRLVTEESLVTPGLPGAVAIADAVDSALAGFQSGALTLPTRTLDKLKAGTAVKFTVLGDSVYQGSTATTPGTDDAMSLLRSTLATRFTSTVTKDNQAQGGRTAWWEMIDKWDAAILANADLYILGITGKNDGAFEAVSSPLVSKHTGHKMSSSLALIESKIRELRVRKPDADVILASGNPYGVAYTAINPVQKAYSQGLARLAAYYGIPYADGWNAVTRSAPGADYAAASRLSDGVHPNSAGHAELFSAFDALFPASYDPANTLVTPSAGLPERIYPKHATKLKEITTASVTAYIDRVLTPSFMGGAWTGTGPWTTSTANDLLYFKAKCTDAAIRFTYGAGQGTVDIIVDGETYISGMSLASVSDADQWVMIPDLRPAVHTIVVKAISGTVVVERFSVATAASEFIDIRDSRVATTNLGATSDINQYWGIHANLSTSTMTVTFDFVGPGLMAEVARPAAGGGAYWANTCTIDGTTFQPALTSTFAGYGSVPIISGLEYGRHTVVLNYQSTGVTTGGFSVLDERPEQHAGQCSGVAKVGETVRPPLPFADSPTVEVSSTTANAANHSTVTATSFLLTGTAGDLVAWTARALKRVLY